MENEIYTEDGVLAYRGETKAGKPYGYGKIFWPNGKLHFDGKFGVKGFQEGKVFYEDGAIQFEGTITLNYGYGPNYPEAGTWYDRDGTVLYSGAFHIHRHGIGGLAYPTCEEPAGFGSIGKFLDLPVKPYMWADEESGQKKEKVKENIDYTALLEKEYGDPDSMELVNDLRKDAKMADEDIYALLERYW